MGSRYWMRKETCTPDEWKQQQKGGGGGDLVQYAVRECHRLARGCISCVVPIILCLSQQDAVKFELQSCFSFFVIYFTHKCITMHVYDGTLSCWQLFQPLWEFLFRVCAIVFAAQNTVRRSFVCSAPLWDTKFNGIETCTHKQTRTNIVTLCLVELSGQTEMKDIIEKENLYPGLCLQERLELSRHNSIISAPHKNVFFGSSVMTLWLATTNQITALSVSPLFHL